MPTWLCNSQIESIPVETRKGSILVTTPEPSALVAWSVLGACGLAIVWRRRRAG